MTDEELKAIEERAAKATPGPWRPKWVAVFVGRGEAEHEIRSRENGLTVAAIRFRLPESPGEAQADPDAEFIAAARSDVPALLEEVRKAKAALLRAHERHIRTGACCVCGLYGHTKDCPVPSLIA